MSKTKLMKMVVNGRNLLSCTCEECMQSRVDNNREPDFEYRFTPKEFQAIMDEAFEKQRKICGKPFKVHSILSYNDIYFAEQPETGIKL